MTTAYREHIGFGDHGARRTLDKMRQYIRDGAIRPDVVEQAHAIVATVPPRDYLGMAHAIRDWLASVFRFIPDTLGVEVLRTPGYMLQQYMMTGRVTGDCDDAAILGLALGKAVGLPGQLVAVGFSRTGPLSHVYGVLTSPAGPSMSPWTVDLDVTRPAGTKRQPMRWTVRRAD